MDKIVPESVGTAGKPVRCRAAVARKPGEPLVIEDVLVAPPKMGEVPLKIICTSLCNSDVTVLKLRDPPAFFPRILGPKSSRNDIAHECLRKKITRMMDATCLTPIPIHIQQIKTMDKSNGTAGKPIRCKGAVARKSGEPLVIEDVIVAPPKSGEVRLKIICTSLCHSDLTYLKLRDPPAFFPRILGHESIGVIESVGDGVTDLAEGDTVLPVFLADCEECADCTSKKSNLCSKYPFKTSPWMQDGTSRFTDLKGETLYHFASVSSFVEYTVVNAANVSKIDTTIPPKFACLLSCAVATGVGAAWRTAKVKAGSTVAIFGLGSIGLAVAEGARLRGAKKIIGVDVNTDKFEISKKFGVTDFVNSANCDNERLSKIITEMTDGGADYCFECVGRSYLVEAAYACCRKGWGKTIVIGVDKPGVKLEVESQDLLHSGKTIKGSLWGSMKPKSDIPILIKSYKDKELDLDKFVTHEVSFEDINKALDLLQEGKSLRTVIWMDK